MRQLNLKIVCEAPVPIVSFRCELQFATQTESDRLTAERPRRSHRYRPVRLYARTATR